MEVLFRYFRRKSQVRNSRMRKNLICWMFGVMTAAIISWGAPVQECVAGVKDVLEEVGDMLFSNREDRPVCGGHHQYYLKDHPNVINSENIVSFTFDTHGVSEFEGGYVGELDEKNKNFLYPVMYVSAIKQPDGRIAVEARGTGRYQQRDGKTFHVKYTVEDDGLMAELQKVVRRYNLSQNNGFVNHTDGIPSGDGDTLSVKYDSEERIYINDNVQRAIPEDPANEIYEIFLASAHKQGLAFSTAGSNVKIYDDPDEEMLQGTWTGKHFGAECICEFTGNHVKIYYDGRLTDDTDYVIVEGRIKPDRKRADNPDRYDDFNTFTSITKANNFTLTGHVYRNNSSSTVSLNKKK